MKKSFTSILGGLLGILTSSVSLSAQGAFHPNVVDPSINHATNMVVKIVNHSGEIIIARVNGQGIVDPRTFLFKRIKNGETSYLSETDIVIRGLASPSCIEVQIENVSGSFEKEALIWIDMDKMRNPDGTYQVRTWIVRPGDISLSAKEARNQRMAHGKLMPQDGIVMVRNRSSRVVKSPIMLFVNQTAYCNHIDPIDGTNLVLSPKQCAVLGKEIVVMYVREGRAGREVAQKVFDAPPDGDWGEAKFPVWDVVDDDYQP
jgi:hypothetical protein